MTKRKSKSDHRKLADLAGIGRAMLKDLALLKIASVDDLARSDGQKLYDHLCRLTGMRHDPCVLDTFNCAVAQARDPRLPRAQCNWWWWSRRRLKGESR